ncbi:MAG: hypothetical protein ACK5U4_09300 [Rhodospirillales bacterium]|jgi:hypothetical protein
MTPYDLVRRYKDALLNMAALEFRGQEYTAEFPPAREAMNAAEAALIAALTARPAVSTADAVAAERERCIKIINSMRVVQGGQSEGGGLLEMFKAETIYAIRARGQGGAT